MSSDNAVTVSTDYLVEFVDDVNNPKEPSSEVIIFPPPSRDAARRSDSDPSAPPSSDS